MICGNVNYVIGLCVRTADIYIIDISVSIVLSVYYLLTN